MSSESKFALLIIDMQNAWVDSGRKLYPSVDGAIVCINKLRSVFARFEWPVFHIALTHASDGSTLSSFESMLWNIEGSPEAQIVAPLAPFENEIVIHKHRYSAFHKTELLDELKKYQITDCVIVGYQARACVLATALDSYQHDFKTHIIAEAVLETDQEHLDIYTKAFKEADLLTSYSDFLKTIDSHLQSL